VCFPINGHLTERKGVSVRSSHLDFRFPPVPTDTCPLKNRGHVDTKRVSSGAAATRRSGCSCASVTSSAHLSSTRAGRVHSVWPTESSSSLPPPFYRQGMQDQGSGDGQGPADGRPGYRWLASPRAVRCTQQREAFALVPTALRIDETKEKARLRGPFQLI
jgi:hypothetical protein